MSFDFSKIRSCIYCGKINGSVLVCCNSCWSKLTSLKTNQQWPVLRGELNHIYLFTWKRQTDKAIRPLAYAIKGAPEPRVFDEFAKLLFVNYRELFSGFQNIVFVPAPAQRLEEVDHAMALAASLAKVFSASLWTGLKRGDVSSQRTKKRRNREKTKLQPASLEEKRWINNNENKQVIFVDDVFTTGSTARAASQLFENKGKFLALSLIYKEYENVDFI